VSTKVLGWGIIGCGDVVRRKSGPSFRHAARSRVVAVMRRDLAQAQQYAAAEGVPLATDNADELLAHTDVDVVYVATPPAAHGKYVRAAAAAGKPVLVEKPMATNAAEARAMVEACRAAGVELFVAYYRRFHPHLLKMRQLLRSGALGDVVTAEIDIALPPPADAGWREDAATGGGGMFVDVGAHRLDAMVSLLGPVQDACGILGAMDPTGRVERAVALTVQFRCGTVCSVTGDFQSGRSADRFCLYGTAGQIIADRLDSRCFEFSVGGKSESYAFDAPPGTHVGFIQHVEKVLAGEEPNASSGADGLQTEEILDRAVRCHYRA